MEWLRERERGGFTTHPHDPFQGKYPHGKVISLELKECLSISSK